MNRNFNSYLKSINKFEDDLSLLNKIFSTEIYKKFHAFFLSHLVSWQKKDSIDSNLLNMFNNRDNYIYKMFFLNIFFFFKFIIFFFFTIFLKFISIFFIIELKKKKFLINFPRVNDSFYEKDINLTDKIKNGIIFEFIYNFKDIFQIKKKYYIFIKYLSFNEIISMTCETIYLFLKFWAIHQKIKKKKIKYLINSNDYNFFNIFIKLIQIRILTNCIKYHQINSIISNALPTSVDSKTFNYISNKLKIKYCCFITKVICKNNLGYSFKKNRELYPNFYFVNSNQNVRVLKKNNYRKNNFFLFKNKKKIFSNYKKFKNDFTVLFVFTRNFNENRKLVQIFKFVLTKLKNIKIFCKFHPQSTLGYKVKNFLENNAINISNLSNSNIEKIFMNNYDKKIIVTSFSSYIYKILNLGFIPIWLKGFGDVDFLFKDITENLGFEIYQTKNFSIVEKKIIKILQQKRLIVNNKNFYSSDYLKYKDFRLFLKNFDRIYYG